MTIPETHRAVLQATAARDPYPQAAQGRLQRLYQMAAARTLVSGNITVIQDSTEPVTFTAIDVETGTFLSLAEMSLGRFIMRTGVFTILETIVQGQSALKIF